MMEVKKKQSSRIYLTPEQLNENIKLSKHNWYLNNNDYYKPGGHGYECLTRLLTCSCGREVKAIKFRRHQRSKLHERRLQAVQVLE